jgi:hypothetical protein
VCSSSRFLPWTPYFRHHRSCLQPSPSRPQGNQYEIAPCFFFCFPVLFSSCSCSCPFLSFYFSSADVRTVDTTNELIYTIFSNDGNTALVSLSITDSSLPEGPGLGFTGGVVGIYNLDPTQIGSNVYSISFNPPTGNEIHPSSLLQLPSALPPSFFLFSNKRRKLGFPFFPINHSQVTKKKNLFLTLLPYFSF